MQSLCASQSVCNGQKNLQYITGWTIVNKHLVLGDFTIKLMIDPRDQS